MKLGMIGLGRMGGNMVARLRERGHDVVGYARSPDKGEVNSLEELVAALEPPRIVWSMIPAGEATESAIASLATLLDTGDVVVDGGNSNYRDSIRHAEQLAMKGVSFVDAGVSGGIWGRDNGYCLMVGGDDATIARLQPIFEDLAPPGGFAHVGGSGAGHFTKMVHNGIEYGLMQSFAEGYELLRASELGIDVPAALSAWRQGSVVRSWLLELLVAALEEDPGLEGVRGYAADSGEGRWTVQEAVRLGVPVPAISAALFARGGLARDACDRRTAQAIRRPRHQGRRRRPAHACAGQRIGETK
jgi:6-phosphogluconate dehydrogenase